MEENVRKQHIYFDFMCFGVTKIENCGWNRMELIQIMKIEALGATEKAVIVKICKLVWGIWKLFQWYDFSTQFTDILQSQIWVSSY